MRTSATTASGGPSGPGRDSGDGPEQLLAVVGLRDDLDADVGQQAHQPAAQQHRVLGDQDAHGSSRTTEVGPPGGLSTWTVPSTALARSRRPASPPPGCAVAPPCPSSLDDDLEHRAGAPDVDGGRRRARVLGDVRQRLGDAEVGDGLDRRVEPPLADVDADVDRHRAAGGERGQGGVEPPVGQHRRRQAPREVAQLGQRGAGLGAGLLEQGGGAVDVAGGQPCAGPAQLHGQRDQPLLRAVVQVALEPASLGLGRLDRRRPGAGDIGQPALELRVSGAEQGAPLGPRRQRDDADDVGPGEQQRDAQQRERQRAEAVERAGRGAVDE